MPTGIFVDAGFYLKRFSAVYTNKDHHDASVVARTLHEMCLSHLTQRDGAEHRDLYRIFVYDCAPLEKKLQFPISKKTVDFAVTPTAVFRHAFHNALKSLRKVALRLGRLQDLGGWRIKPSVLLAILRGHRDFNSLVDRDFEYEVRQKGTDMRLGLDIASVAFKKQVDQIILVAGDADFMPAAKLARREGIDFILDPMWHPHADDLHEHIDGLRSMCPRPVARPYPATSPRIGVAT
ncbi:MAG TPA: NYN domain-containing protein [Rhizomicrobium sp.]|jgi:uncharacterized LabA/DUF88 family protein|nr:NYN domain-containing protein [Rhizomicrobium sp.]